ncbi:MAG: DUF1501 domain-containing protein [Actinomycetota bacterium]|nr:DUF1501 domain-containing protein [Actinomycetota bacterium]
MATTTSLDRRRFITWGGAGAAGLALSGAAVTRLAFGDPANPAAGDVLVQVFLRGGADGLSLVVPYGEGLYYDNRSSIAIPEPGQTNGALDLNGFFGFHPAMSALYEGPWAAGDLAVVHATGLPDDTPHKRSHFEAQEYVERCAITTSGSGWLARHLASSGGGSVLSGVGIGGSLSSSLKGYGNAISLWNPRNFGIQGFPGGVRNDVAPALSDMYAAATGALGDAAGSTLGALGTMGSIDWDSLGPANGAEYRDNGLGRGLGHVARLIKSGVGLRAATVDFGGWDMHDNMGSPTDGWMAGRAAELADGLAAFYTDLGSAMSEVTVVVVSEFGRTTEENGNNGTDHGRGNMMLAMGGGISQGVYTDWPTLSRDDGDRDVNVTIDYRTILAEIAANRLDNVDLERIFPNFAIPDTFVGVTTG